MFLLLSFFFFFFKNLSVILLEGHTAYAPWNARMFHPSQRFQFCLFISHNSRSSTDVLCSSISFLCLFLKVSIQSNGIHYGIVIYALFLSTPHLHYPPLSPHFLLLKIIRQSYPKCSDGSITVLDLKLYYRDIEIRLYGTDGKTNI